MPLSLTDACPCGRPAAAPGRSKAGDVLPFSDCCARYLNHADIPAPDAQALMRSRYSAFVLCNADYLLATWHASTRPATLELDRSAKWLGLDVRTHRALGADQAEVAFVARYREGGRAVRLHERSRFVREAGRWYYVEGDQL